VISSYSNVAADSECLNSNPCVNVVVQSWFVPSGLINATVSLMMFASSAVIASDVLNEIPYENE
jgi:hypothetical protein